MEQCRLFLLIALGETVVTPGAALASAPIRITTLASGALALAGTLCLWWLCFHAEPLALKHAAGTEKSRVRQPDGRQRAAMHDRGTDRAGRRQRARDR
jgi:low temperature requirement protein LtrA